ncbi:hypothetical protein L612_002600000510 [Rhodococcus rhodochrous J38]|uniref:hypothetical protein n=1 Tax=Rhodococcus rhodochrous TaxID=1829 RepID=UPI0011ADF089|nr:hypothetical protein [Rhodococcus rhodochrous]TWH51541.1 hypothetical protein L612_002600000510 [Rhodococcus rhodochrous J38]
MWRTWILSAAMVAVAAVVLLTGAFDVTSVVTAVLLLALAWVVSPLFFPHHVDDATARRDAAARGVPVVYWRPGARSASGCAPLCAPARVARSG